jgi:hypothetical protein
MIWRADRLSDVIRGAAYELSVSWCELPAKKIGGEFAKISCNAIYWFDPANVQIKPACQAELSKYNRQA